MARPLRLEFASALYHITSRGDRREAIYEDDQDRMLFLDILGEVVERLGWRLHAYCLMGNHYHLMVETPRANLATGMRQLNGVFTQGTNRRHGRVGHLFQGRYKAILVERDAYLLELSRYIVLNPVRAGMVAQPADWPWSSYRATAGLDSVPPWLTVDWLLDAFSADRSTARASYAAFVGDAAGTGSVWADLKSQVFLGSDAFVADMKERIEDAGQDKEIPRRQWLPEAKSLTEIAAAAETRDEAIRTAHASGRYTLSEIGEHFRLHYSRVSRIARKRGP